MLRQASLAIGSIALAIALSIYAAAKGPDQTCPEPSAQSVEMLFAPCVAAHKGEGATAIREAYHELRRASSEVLVARAP